MSDDTDDDKDDDSSQRVLFWSAPKRIPIPSCPTKPEQPKGWTVLKFMKPRWLIDTNHDDGGYYLFYWYLNNDTKEQRITPPEPVFEGQDAEIDNDDDDNVNDDNQNITNKNFSIDSFFVRTPDVNTVYHNEVGGLKSQIRTAREERIEETKEEAELLSLKPLSKRIISMKGMKHGQMKDKALKLNLFVQGDTKEIMEKKVFFHFLQQCKSPDEYLGAECFVPEKQRIDRKRKAHKNEDMMMKQN